MSTSNITVLTKEEQQKNIEKAIRDRDNFAKLLTKTESKLEKYVSGPPKKLKSTVTKVVNSLDSDTTERIVRANKKMCEYLHNLANEPSIGLYHICDHIKRSVPKLVTLKKSLRKDTKAVDDFNYDLESTLLTIRGLGQFQGFDEIQKILISCMTTVEMINRGEPPKPKIPEAIVATSEEQAEKEGTDATPQTTVNTGEENVSNDTLEGNGDLSLEPSLGLNTATIDPDFQLKSFE
eukprot:TRINITY_DN14840_c0_g1_i1.p1 TRINITY_DN14840_c0_g1~~TRINITY_DN14840_c0_g1_i1.p1  ORF type:complete len:236 (-),score=48.60 TRINITY_DN14840_c0_g1_i1:95-802(-)